MDTNTYHGVCPAREANPPPGEISLHGRQIADDETRRYCFARLRARSNAGQGEGAGDVSCPLTADLGGNSAWNCCYGGAAAMAMAMLWARARLLFLQLGTGLRVCVDLSTPVRLLQFLSWIPDSSHRGISTNLPGLFRN